MTQRNVGLGVQSRGAFAIRRWAVVAVLFLVMMANWVDKSVVSLAATEIMREFALTPAEYGLLGSAFFSLYAVTGLFVAFAIAPRFTPRKILMVLLFCWAVVQLPIAFAASFPVLVICRTLLGMGEGAATPTTLNAAYEWFPNEARGLPTAFIIFGAAAGAMVAAPALTAIIQAHGWRSAFIACVAFGLVVFLLWFLVSAAGPFAADLSGQSARPVPAGASSVSGHGSAQLWRDPTLIGVTITGLMSYWLTAFQVSWLAPYLRILTGNPQDAAWLFSVILLVQGVSIFGMSFLSQRLLNRGVSSRQARGALMGAQSGDGGTVPAGHSLLAFSDRHLADRRGHRHLCGRAADASCDHKRSDAGGCTKSGHDCNPLDRHPGRHSFVCGHRLPYLFTGLAGWGRNERLRGDHRQRRLFPPHQSVAEHAKAGVT